MELPLQQHFRRWHAGVELPPWGHHPSLSEPLLEERGGSQPSSLALLWLLGARAGRAPVAPSTCLHSFIQEHTQDLSQKQNLCRERASGSTHLLYTFIPMNCQTDGLKAVNL